MGPALAARQRAQLQAGGGVPQAHRAVFAAGREFAAGRVEGDDAHRAGMAQDAPGAAGERPDAHRAVARGRGGERLVGAQHRVIDPVGVPGKIVTLGAAGRVVDAHRAVAPGGDDVFAAAPDRGREHLVAQRRDDALDAPGRGIDEADAAVLAGGDDAAPVAAEFGGEDLVGVAFAVEQQFELGLGAARLDLADARRGVAHAERVGFAVPAERRVVVGVGAQPLLVHDAEMVARVAVLERRRARQQLPRRAVIARHAGAVEIHQRHFVDRELVVLARRALVPGQRLGRRGRIGEPALQDRGEAVLRLGQAGLRRALVARERGLEIAGGEGVLRGGKFARHQPVLDRPRHEIAGGGNGGDAEPRRQRAPARRAARRGRGSRAGPVPRPHVVAGAVQQGTELGDGLRPRRFDHAQRGIDRGDEAGRKISRRDFGERPQRIGRLVEHGFGAPVRGRRHRAGEAAIGGGADGVEIGPRAELAVGVVLLPRRITRRHDLLGRAREAREIGFGGAEIDQLGRAVGQHQDVRGLDVAMQDIGAMHGVEPVEQRRQQRAQRRFDERPAGEALRQRRAVLVFHHVIGGGIGLEDAQHAHDAGMVEPRDDARLVDELGAAGAEAGLELAADRAHRGAGADPGNDVAGEIFLDRDRAAAELLLGAVGDAEAAAPQHVAEHVAVEFDALGQGVDRAVGHAMGARSGLMRITAAQRRRPRLCRRTVGENQRYMDLGERCANDLCPARRGSGRG